jgi:hypothetical protein
MIRALVRILATLAIVLSGAFACVYAVIRDRCTVTVVTELVSPDGVWRALVDDTLCESLFLTHEVAGVSLISIHNPGRSADILAVSADTADERPVIAWIAPKTLQVDVPSSVYLKVLACEFDGIRINIRLPPEDAANRAAYYHQTGHPDPDPAGKLAKKCP